MSLDPLLLKNYIINSGLKFKQTSNSYIFKCPQPECNKEDKFYIKKSNGIFICWVCGYRGSRPEYALSKVLDIPLSEILFDLYGNGEAKGNHIQSFQLEDFDFIDDKLVSLKPIAAPYNFYALEDPKSKRGVDYLESRGIDLDLANKYHITYCPEQRRVIFPAEFEGNLYGWQGRWVIDGEPRMINSKSEDGWRAKILMFMDRLKGSKHCVLCEGPIDAIKADLCGANICTMGKLVSPFQLNIIRRMGIEDVYIALDPDAAEETQKIVKDLTKDLKCYLMEVPSNFKDIGQMEPKDVLELHRGAKRVNNNRLFLYLKNEK